MGHKYVKEEDTFSTSANGTVPKPSAADVSANKVLQANGTWVAQSSGGMHTYSTSEQVVGTWIDGKPIYERVFELPSTLTVPSNTWTNTSVSNTNMNAILKATAITTSGTLFDFLGAARDSGSYVRLLQVRQSGIEINILILQYTKTTD